jgi:hypothetical protein
MSTANLNWASAEVKDGRLSVALEGELPKGWKQSFETTVRLLGSGDWGKVALKKRTVQVSDVTAGDEEKLRHYLESVVEQANASRGVDEPEREESADEPEGKRDDDNDPDAQMTERFRSFAGTGGEA